MSKEVLEAQQWLNKTYGYHKKYIKVKETGYPGTATSKALVSAIQIQFNAESKYITGFFGSKSEALCNKSENILSVGSTGDAVKILQYGLYSKGYNPKSVDGIFDEDTKIAIIKIQTDAGLLSSKISSKTNGLIMKAVLGIDEYKKVGKGDSKIREMQQELNRTYLNYTGLCPCDGIYSRGTNKALIYALQSEENMPTSVANGYFGPSTKRCCPDIPYNKTQTDYKDNKYSNESIKHFIKLAQYTLYCIGYDRENTSLLNHSKYDCGEFNGEFNNKTKSALHKFQEDVALIQRDKIARNEWMAMLLSTGNPDRSATACDCATKITSEYAQLLKNNGYKYVGRYLTGKYYNSHYKKYMSKALDQNEIKNIFNAGLNFFPIFEGNGTNRSYFSFDKGKTDAILATKAAKNLGIPMETTIYYAVDFDATSYDIEKYIIPYFKGIYKLLEMKFNTYLNNPYKIGVYGTRNVCSKVEKALKEFGLNITSFVADMSTGWSGNMGFSLPKNWAFDQFNNRTVSKGSISLEIDKDACSGKDKGVSFVNDVDEKTELELLKTNARHKFITETIQMLPKFDNIPIDYSIGSTVVLAEIPLAFKATLNTTEEVSTEGSNNLNNVFNVVVKEGKIDHDLKINLHNIDIDVNKFKEQKDKYINILDSVALKVKEGNIAVKISRSEKEKRFSVSFTISSEEIFVNSDTNTSLSTTVTYSFYDNKNLDKDLEKEVEKLMKFVGLNLEYTLSFILGLIVENAEMLLTIAGIVALLGLLCKCLPALAVA